jgi:precorrin-2 methylase
MVIYPVPLRPFRQFRPHIILQKLDMGAYIVWGDPMTSTNNVDIVNHVLIEITKDVVPG